MKNLFVRCNYYITCLLCLLSSCSNSDTELSITKRQDKNIAMEVYTHSTVIDQTEYLQAGLHDEFLHPDVVAQLTNDPFLRQKLRSSATEDNDTIFSYDEIPLVREIKSYTCIFQDGTLQSTTDYPTPFEANALYQLNENPPSEATRISRTVEKDGSLKIYNTRGELIAEELFPVSDMKDFLDTMKIYVQKCKDRSAHDEDTIVMNISGVEKILPAASRISSLPSGHVILELDLQSLPAEATPLPRISGVIKSRTELNEDMTRTLKFELFKGDYLIQRKMYAYQDKAALRNLYRNKVISENPESVESESLMLNSKGFPVLHHTKELFYRNQTYYHFND